MRRAFVGFAVAVSVVAILAPPGTAASYRSRTLTFHYPAGWHVHRQVYPDGTTTLVRLSNTRVGAACTFVRLRPTGCTRLRRGGVLVEWVLSDAWRPMPPFLGILRPGPCKAIGGDETIASTFWIPYYSFVACIRGPGTRATERQLRAMRASVRFPRHP